MKPRIKMRRPLYTGDPNASMTMCYKKLRRHLSRDLVYVPISLDKAPEDDPDAQSQVALLVRCRHCFRDPIIDVSKSASQSP